MMMMIMKKRWLVQKVSTVWEDMSNYTGQREQFKGGF
jgi:hypothetical protein